MARLPMDNYIACAGCDRTEARVDRGRMEGWRLDMPTFRLFCPDCASKRGLLDEQAQEEAVATR